MYIYAWLVSLVYILNIYARKNTRRGISKQKLKFGIYLDRIVFYK